MGTMRSVWLALALLLAGCPGGTKGPDTGVDSDDDGVVDAEDCAAWSKERWRTLEVFRDEDGDGLGAGGTRLQCIGERPPVGWALTAGDCADGDASRWREVPGLYPDRDGDGATAPGPVTGCVGDSLGGFHSQPGPEDCDDTDGRYQQTARAWRDLDGDGHGSDTSVTYCLGARLPAGHVALEGDCAPYDSTRAVALAYTYRDADADGFTVPEQGTLCATTLPSGYLNTARDLDCDDRSATRWRLRDVYVDTDGDGFGAGAAEARCIGDAPGPGFAWEGEDCAAGDGTRWQWRSYAHRDQDGDGATVPQTGVQCSGEELPDGYHVWPGALDCDDTSPARRVSWDVYPDTDGDGVGAGARQTLCAGGTLPQGYSARDSDCATSDATRWQVLAFSHRDGDGDGFTVPQTGTVCSGATLPAGHATSARGLDCDDTVPARHTSVQAWVDTDADGVGAGEPVVMCTDGTVPKPWSGSGTDCAADDGTRWRMLPYAHVDRDEDGHTQSEAGGLCAGAELPEPYFAQAKGNDCDDTDASLFRWAVLYPDADGDGVGAGARTVPCLGRDVPRGFSFKGYDVDDRNASVQEDAEDDLLVELLLMP
ncbi:hypothetical protein HPC49_37920 [Pyxidicoccus fallax]|uniref:Lipoprotein n=1 Tax=Pyxidicoccus fallax TaxID=394095 RepID=A0A848LXP8_9BACT|nr:hypothetical protein [Pyxidicoccus fallax]NMO22014.1 hypothetical protein [Pyxidicoccus fallax]NPC83979.1 hypothetical protein [Pyxidicoccus fallax]